MLAAVAGRGRWSRVWLVRAASAGVVVLGVAAPLLMRVAWEGAAELREADAAAERGRVDLEIVHLGRAARWRAPLASHDEAALARLLAIADRDAGSQTALMAWREARAALLATRVWGPADAATLDAVNREIAGTMAAQERVFGTDLSGRGEAEAFHLRLLEQPPPATGSWGVMVGLAIVAAALGLIVGVPETGRVRVVALGVCWTIAVVLAMFAMLACGG